MPDYLDALQASIEPGISGRRGGLARRWTRGIAIQALCKFTMCSRCNITRSLPQSLSSILRFFDFSLRRRRRQAHCCGVATRPERSSLPQPTQGPRIAAATARTTTEYMIWR